MYNMYIWTMYIWFTSPLSGAMSAVQRSCGDAVEGITFRGCIVKHACLKKKLLDPASDEHVNKHGSLHSLAEEPGHPRRYVHCCIEPSCSTCL